MKRLVRTKRDLGNSIREIRLERDMTQKELANLSGIWQETISKIETGTANPRMGTISLLLSALDLEFVLTPRSKGSLKDWEKIFTNGP